MAWSARELGELAGTSRRTVRHYQELGLLREPWRSSNGYQHYDVTHLVRLLRIRRLTELGLPLATIRELGEADEHPTEALRARHIELKATIDHLQGLHAELGDIVAHAAPVDLPVDLADATRELSRSDRSLTVVMSRVLSDDAVRAWRQLLVAYGPAPAVTAFDKLRPDADPGQQARVAADLSHHMSAMAHDVPDAFAPVLDQLARRARSRRAVDLALRQLYHDVQLDVVRRVRAELAPTMRAILRRS